MGTVVVEHDGQLAPSGHTDQVLGACLLQRGLDPKTGRHRCLHTFVNMFQHVSHALVRLGEGPRLLARLQAGLGGRLHTEALEVRSELVVGHEHLLHRCLTAHTVAQIGHQGALAGTDFFEVLLQQRHVEFNHWVGVHPQRLINHQQLAGWETHLELVEQLLGQVHIVLAVLAVLSEVSLSEVSLALAQCSHHLITLLAQPVVRHQLGE